MEPRPLDRAWQRGRTSIRARRARLRSKRFLLVQCALAGGVAWFVSAELLGHPTPFFAPIAAVVGLGTSYGQRPRRVAEITMGVAIGIFLADLLVLWLGSGAWQIAVVILLAMSAGVWLSGGQLFVTQSAVQSIIIVALVAQPITAFTRWLDALVGGVVALVAATIVPAAALREPRRHAAVVTRTIARLLRASADVMRHGEPEEGLDLLADARSTDHLVRELQAAADEGMSVVAVSPFRRRHGPDVRRVADLVEPLDRALRTTRVLVRQSSVSAYHRLPLPASYAGLTDELADAVEVMAAELGDNERAEAALAALLRVARDCGVLERSELLVADAILAQLRSLIVDLLMVAGLAQLEATDAMPPPRGS